MPNTEKDYRLYVNAWKSMWGLGLEAIAYNRATCDPTKVEPQVLEWVRQNSAQEPHFVKVIIGAVSYGWHRRGGTRTCQMVSMVCVWCQVSSTHRLHSSVLYVLNVFNGCALIHVLVR